jgi:DNA-binding protein
MVEYCNPVFLNLSNGENKIVVQNSGRSFSRAIDMLCSFQASKIHVLKFRYATSFTGTVLYSIKI